MRRASLQTRYEHPERVLPRAPVRGRGRRAQGRILAQVVDQGRRPQGDRAEEGRHRHALPVRERLVRRREHPRQHAIDAEGAGGRAEAVHQRHGAGSLHRPAQRPGQGRGHAQEARPLRPGQPLWRQRHAAHGLRQHVRLHRAAQGAELDHPVRRDGAHREQRVRLLRHQPPHPPEQLRRERMGRVLRGVHRALRAGLGRGAVPGDVHHEGAPSEPHHVQLEPARVRGGFLQAQHQQGHVRPRNHDAQRGA